MKPYRYMLMVYNMDHGCYVDHMESEDLQKLKIEANNLRVNNREVTTIRLIDTEPVNYESVFALRYRNN